MSRAGSGWCCSSHTLKAMVAVRSMLTTSPLRVTWASVSGGAWARNSLRCSWGLLIVVLLWGLAVLSRTCVGARQLALHHGAYGAPQRRSNFIFDSLLHCGGHRQPVEQVPVAVIDHADGKCVDGG